MIALMQLDKKTIRILWAAELALFLALVLPGALGQPYARPAGPWIVYGGLMVWAATSLALIALIGRAPKAPRGAMRRRPR